MRTSHRRTGDGAAVRHVVRWLALASCVALCAAPPAAARASTAGHIRRSAPPRTAVAPEALGAPSLGQLIAPDASATDVASAVSSQPGLVTGASWPALDGGAANPASPSAVGVATGFVGRYMPDDGPSFGVLTNGDVAIADPPNNSTGAGVDDGTSARNVNDLSILQVDVHVPAGDNCLSVDTVFYSEEYPEYVGTQFNDAFIAELDHNDWTYDPVANTIVAPSNFAFDENGNLLSVNSASFTDAQDTLLQYDGSTRLLTAATPVSPGDHTLYFSIYDAGDHVFDSAAFLDNLHTFHTNDGQCSGGAVLADTDGDGIPDSWELHGYDGNHDGDLNDPEDVNLPAMGADPLHKDVFVQLDAMPALRLSNAALQTVESSFDHAPVDNPDGTQGIHLHVDNGAGSVMNPATGATWGSLSRAATVPFADPFGWFDGGEYDWSVLQAAKTANLPPGRVPIFHYAASVTRYGRADNGSSGISRLDTSSVQAASNGGSDFIVSLGNANYCKPEGTCVGPLAGQAGTFMHELGHNLGLLHGGRDIINYKPNYLSVMNYAFQLAGLVGAPRAVDYSRYGRDQIADADESGLAELGGLVPPGSPLAGIRTVWRCPSGAAQTHTLDGPFDWNCDGAFDLNLIPVDVNGDGALSPLTSFDDWSALKFKGGAIGGLGLEALQPATTDGSDEPQASTLQQAADALVPPPEAVTGDATGVGVSNATIGGIANPHASSAQAVVQYGTTEAYGTTTGAVDGGSGDVPTTVAIPLDGLSPGTTYHYRVVVQTDAHFAYGADRAFTTAAPGPPPGPAVCPKGQKGTPPHCVRAARGKVCVVPRLTGLGLAAAKRALRRAHCALGRVARPRHVARGARLVVTRQSPKARTRRRAGSRVRVTLGVRHVAHRRRR